MKFIFIIILTLPFNIWAQIPFSPIVNLSNTGFATSDYQTLSSEGSNFYLIWGDNGEIKYKRSSNAGISWSSNLTVSQSASTCGWPAIATSGNKVYIIYHCLNSPPGYDILFQRSTDYGQSFSAPMKISSATQLGITPQLVVSGDSVFAVWEERINTNYEIYFRKSYDGGLTWSPLKNLTNNSTFSRWVTIQRSAGIIYLAWLESPSYPTSDIYFMKSSDDGETWSIPVNLSNDALPQNRITMRVLENSIYIASDDMDQINLDEVRLMKSTDLGNTWSTPQNISNNAGHSGFPSIAVMKELNGMHRIYISWPDNTHSAPAYDNQDIYFKYSTNSGVNWSSIQNLSNNPENSYRPHIIVSVHPGVDTIGIGWYDFSTGDAEILFRTGVYTYPVSVELSSFTAVSKNGAVEIKWTTATELNNKGFNIFSKNSFSEWKNIGWVTGSGTTSDKKEYFFSDKSVSTGKIFYRLGQEDYDGSIDYSPEIFIDHTIKFGFSLSNNYPNPFNPGTTVKYTIGDEKSFVSLKLYDMLGNEVAILVNDYQSRGEYSQYIDAAALGLNSGIYFYSLLAGNFTKTVKICYLK